jgi:hypothetical protein
MGGSNLCVDDEDVVDEHKHYEVLDAIDDAITRIAIMD